MKLLRKSNKYIRSSLESFVTNKLNNKHYDYNVEFDYNVGAAVFDYLDLTRKPFNNEDVEFLRRLGFTANDFYDMLDDDFYDEIFN